MSRPQECIYYWTRRGHKQFLLLKFSQNAMKWQWYILSLWVSSKKSLADFRQCNSFTTSIYPPPLHMFGAQQSQEALPGLDEGFSHCTPLSRFKMLLSALFAVCRDGSYIYTLPRQRGHLCPRSWLQKILHTGELAGEMNKDLSSSTWTANIWAVALGDL